MLRRSCPAITCSLVSAWRASSCRESWSTGSLPVPPPNQARRLDAAASLRERRQTPPRHMLLTCRSSFSSAVIGSATRPQYARRNRRTCLVERRRTSKCRTTEIGSPIESSLQGPLEKGRMQDGPYGRDALPHAFIAQIEHYWLLTGLYSCGSLQGSTNSKGHAQKSCNPQSAAPHTQPRSTAMSEAARSVSGLGFSQAAIRPPTSPAREGRMPMSFAFAEGGRTFRPLNPSPAFAHSRAIRAPGPPAVVNFGGTNFERRDGGLESAQIHYF